MHTASSRSFQTSCSKQVLVTHHVELVLPGTYYLVRMLGGRIDVQGVVKELRGRGVLESVIQDVESEPNKSPEDEQNGVTKDSNKDEEGVEPEAEQDAKTKKPRKLIKDEERESGSVNWVIYKTYLKASYVLKIYSRLEFDMDA